jgi:hypothetical protein
MAAYEAAVARARDERWAERLWDRDPTLWSGNDRVQAAIADRLGWLDAPAHFTAQIAALEGFGDGIRDAGFTTAVVGGMGGSSLAPDVFHRTFGSGDVALAGETSPGHRGAGAAARRSCHESEEARRER